MHLSLVPKNMEMQPGALNIGIAVLAAVILLGPFAVLVWFSWRNLLAGAMLFGAFAIVMFSMMAVGYSGWTPGGSPGAVLLIAAVLAAGLAFGAWTIATGSVAFRLGTVALSVAAFAWATAGWDVLASTFGYANVPIVDYLAVRFGRGVPVEPDRYRVELAAGSATLRDSLDRASGMADPDAPSPSRDLLLVRNAAGDTLQLTPREDLDIAFVGSPVIRKNRMFIRFISDRRLDPYLAGREVVLVTWPSNDVTMTPRRRVPLLFTTAKQLHGSRIPGFFDPSSGGFRHGPYRWMEHVLQVPKAERDAIHRRYFGPVPE